MKGMGNVLLQAITAATDMTLLVVKNKSMLLYGTTNNHHLLDSFDFQTARHRPALRPIKLKPFAFIGLDLPLGSRAAVPIGDKVL